MERITEIWNTTTLNYKREKGPKWPFFVIYDLKQPKSALCESSQQSVRMKKRSFFVTLSEARRSRRYYVAHAKYRHIPGQQWGYKRNDDDDKGGEGVSAVPAHCCPGGYDTGIIEKKTNYYQNMALG